MHIHSAAGPLESATLVGGRELAEGLVLMRASTLKMIRLQLAMERHDRRVALEAVDDLITLDNRLQDYLQGIPDIDNQQGFQREIEAERAALNQEKLTLAAEVLRAPPKTAEDDTVAEADEWIEQYEPRYDVEPEPRRRWWLAVIPILLIGLAAAAYVLIDPGVMAWLADAAGGLG